MEFINIRRATIKDKQRLNAAARKICAGNWYLQGVAYWAGETSPTTIELTIEQLRIDGFRVGKWRQQWRRCARRALKHNRANEIRNGQVGYWSDALGNTPKAPEYVSNTKCEKTVLSRT